MEDKHNRTSFFKRPAREINTQTSLSTKNSLNRSIGNYLSQKLNKPTIGSTPGRASTRMSPRDFSYAVNYPVPIIYSDGLNERFIEKNRHRINIRDQNAFEERQKMQRKRTMMLNKDPD